MTKYLLKRLLHGLLSLVIVVAIVMILIYSCLDRNLIFASDSIYSRMNLNAKEIYKVQSWEKFGYVDYVPYSDYLKELSRENGLSDEDYTTAVKLGATAEKDSELTQTYVAKFIENYENKGYTIVRLDGKLKGNTKKYHDGGEPYLYAVKDVPLTNRLLNYFKNLISIDDIDYAEGIADEDRGIQFTLHDPLYNGEKISPAIIGNGTKHKYLLYCDDQFPYIHQNLVNINLGTSYSVNRGIDVFDTMTNSQGSFVHSTVTYPSGRVEDSADNLHSATYVQGSLENGTVVTQQCFVDDYTSITVNKNGLSKIGYSFAIGIISVILAYLLAIPLGTFMALKKDKLVDKLGTIYIVFILAVPSLAYIFMFKTIGGSFGLPTTFDVDNATWLMYVLPVISLALPSIANLMKWLRRYLIDQMNSDYVKFARSGGLSEREIFTKHILKNAMIPIIHGIPASCLGALVGAIITERVYVVPGAGNLLTNAINAYDNGVIVGVTLFYGLLSVVSIILGDLLMSMVDPRISFTTERR